LKKRKIEMEKKQEIKKPSSSILIGKAHLKSVLKSSSSTNPSHVHGSSSQPDPSMLVQSQTAARVRVQIDAPKPIKHAVPSEDIELPEINSEYSDSEDEDRVRTFNPPEWAQSPELRQALEMQSTMNPDDIFGAVRPLKMEEIFKSRTSRFRARTSSANWTGTDRLTMQEQGEYARRMGFK
jgi:Inner centromere protein, ARK binding region